MFKKILISIIFVNCLINAQTITIPQPILYSSVNQIHEPAELTAEDISNIFLQRQFRDIRIHKAMAFTTAGLLLASDAIGAYHFFDLRNQGHKFRDSIGFSEGSTQTQPQTNEIQNEWRSTSSQNLRVLHGALITASSICYAITATIELSMPRMSRNPLKYSDTHIHRNVFLLHASLMAANIGLGFAESWALSEGKHDLVQGLGIAHVVIGFSAPVVMCTSGLAFKLPWH